MSTPNRPPFGQRTAQRTARRPSTQQRARPPGYTPRRSDPDAIAAAALNLARNKTPSRKNQRPWTLKEWSFVETIPKNIDSEAIKRYMFKFQEKFKWMPSEGQFRSQYWYFKKSARQMREFLVMHAKYEQERNAIKQTEVQMVTRLKTTTLRPSW